MILAPKRNARGRLAVTLRKALLRKQRMVAFSQKLIREAGLEDCRFVAFVLDGDEMRLRPMKKGVFMGQQIHKISKDGGRPNAGIWTRQDILPEKLFPSGVYPARMEKGWIVVSIKGAEKKYLRHVAEQKLARERRPRAD